MSEARINPDGSATMKISGNADALKTIEFFFSRSSKTFEAFESRAKKSFEAVALTADKTFIGFRAQTDTFTHALKATSRETLATGAGGRSLEGAFNKPASKVDVSSKSAAFNAAALGALKGGAQYALESVVGLGDALDKMSKRTGFGVEALSTLSYAATQCGTDVETVEGAIRGYQSVLADAANGSTDAAETLSRLGLDAAKLAVLSPEEQLRALFDALGRIEDPTRRAAAMEIMGDDGAKLGPIFADGTATLDAFAAEAREVGAVMSDEQAAASAELASATNRLKGSLHGVAVQLGGALIPTLQAGADKLTAFVRKIGELTAAQPGLVAGLTKFATVAAAAFGAGRLVKTLSDYGAAFGALIPKIAGATQALYAFAATNPILAGLGGAALAVAALGSAFYDSKKYVAQFSDAAAKAVEEGDRLRRLNATKFDFLQEIANQGELSNETFERGKRYVDDLQGALGDLGFQYDETTKSIAAATGAQDAFNKAQREQAIRDLDAQIAEEEENAREAEKAVQAELERQNGRFARVAFAPRNVASYVTGGYVDSVEDKMVADLKPLQDDLTDIRKRKGKLIARREKLRGGDDDAALGLSEEESVASTVATGTAEVGETVAAKEAEAKAVEDLNARIAKAEEDRAAREMSASKRRSEAIKKEMKELTDAIDARLEVLRASASTEDDFAEIYRLETAKAGIEADGKARVADVEKEEADKKDAERERLNDQIAAEEERVADESRTDEERRLAQIDKETAAYKELLADALKLAETEEERAKIQAKIDAADATAKERKDAVLAASKAAEEEEEARRELENFDAFGGDEEDAAPFFESVDAGADVAAKTVSSGATFSAHDAQKLGANNPAEENVKETKRTNALLAGLLDRWDESDFSLRIA
ncbi:MAG: hypothetical protein IJY15_05045 [Thermoguttaceae bacterium]|nr:hypothetical protein [Thermoguttaceae bacterium]